jgi:hypothetical protein
MKYKYLYRQRQKIDKYGLIKAFFGEKFFFIFFNLKMCCAIFGGIVALHAIHKVRVNLLDPAGSGLALEAQSRHHAAGLR